MAVDLRRLHNLATTLQARVERSRHRQESGSWYRIENAASSRAEIYLYDIIGEWGVSAQDFVNDLRDIGSGAIDLHINCEGGEVFDGVAIYESLLQYRRRGEIHGYVDGIAASSASFILQACNMRTMARNGRMMIHNAHGWCMGNADDMRDAADLLDDLSENIASIYQDRAGGTVQEWRDAMRGSSRTSGARAVGDGTWYTAQAAVDAGLADEVGAGPFEGDGSGNTWRGQRQREESAGASRSTVDSPQWDPAAIAEVFASVGKSVDEVNNPRPPIDFDPKKLINMFREVAS